MIIVSYEGDINSLDNVKYYFENQRRSGGDHVVSCKQDDIGRIFIEFESNPGENIFNLCFHSKHILTL